MPSLNKDKFVKSVIKQVTKHIDSKRAGWAKKGRELQKEQFDKMPVYYKGRSKRLSYFKIDKLSESWLVRNGVDLGQVPYAPIWYYNLSRKLRYKYPRNVYRVTTENWLRWLVEKDFDMKAAGSSMSKIESEFKSNVTKSVYKYDKRSKK